MSRSKRNGTRSKKSVFHNLRTLLLDLRALLLDLALPQTTPSLDRFSKLRLDRNSSDTRGLELRYHATWQEDPCTSSPGQVGACDFLLENVCCIN